MKVLVKKEVPKSCLMTRIRLRYLVFTVSQIDGSGIDTRSIRKLEDLWTYEGVRTSKSSLIIASRRKESQIISKP